MNIDEPLHNDLEIAELGSAEEVVVQVKKIYGGDLCSTGLVHGTAVWHGGAGAYVTLEIKPETPRCLHDLFALGLSRARADAILTTGKILRQEPQLTHTLVGPAQVPSALAAWRREVLGKESAPVTLVLTSGKDLDLAHPLFHSGTRAVIFTTREGQWALESQAANHGVEVVGVENPGAHSAVEFLRREFGAATISIEAGPSVSRQFYEPPLRVDELLLSVYEASRIPQSVEGGFFLPRPDLERFFRKRSAPYGVKTEGGSWSLRRFLL
jgi:riboflavin biosynthesis pyrimidine reductase